MLTQAKYLRPGDKIIHPVTGSTVMIRMTTWTSKTITFSFYGTKHEPIAMSKTALIDKETP